MLICENCGNIFDEVEGVLVEEEYGERFLSCPCCHSTDWSESETCRVCRGAFKGEDLFDGVCRECLDSTIDYDNFYAYLLDGYDDNRPESPTGLEEFFFVAVWHLPECPSMTSLELRQDLQDKYKSLVATDKMTKDKHFLATIKDWISGKDIDVEDFAEFMHERGYL